MNLPLSVAVAQPEIVVGDRSATLRAHCDVVRRAQARLVVFPELSLTGYDFSAEPVDDHRCLVPLQAACALSNSIALVGAPTTVTRSGGVAISTLAVTGAGVDVIYHKMSLGLDEQQRFVAGTAPASFAVDGWEVGVGICKDTRIDAHLKATFGVGIDLYVAGLVHHGHEVGELERRARHIVEEADVPVAFANAAGDVGPPYIDAGGGSAIWDRHGECRGHTGERPGEFATVVLESFDR